MKPRQLKPLIQRKWAKRLQYEKGKLGDFGGLVYSLVFYRRIYKEPLEFLKNMQVWLISYLLSFKTEIPGKSVMWLWFGKKHLKILKNPECAENSEMFQIKQEYWKVFLAHILYDQNCVENGHLFFLLSYMPTKMLRLYGGEKRQNCYFSLWNVHMFSSTLSSKSGKVMLQVCR